mmetsp:Transcript_96367/g.249212  ORF Transcript_96367/g.249212 Transcript_96367/m.249212 type:complete len:215 (+) Transcript_96367:1768-2412(+)
MGAVPVQTRRVPLRHTGLQDRVYLQVLLRDPRHRPHHVVPVYGVRPRLRRVGRAGAGVGTSHVPQCLPALVPRRRRRHRLCARARQHRRDRQRRDRDVVVGGLPVRQRCHLLYLRPEPLHRGALRGLQLGRRQGGGALLRKPCLRLPGAHAAAAHFILHHRPSDHRVPSDRDHWRRGVVVTRGGQATSRCGRPARHGAPGRPGAAESALGREGE